MGLRAPHHCTTCGLQTCCCVDFVAWIFHKNKPRKYTYIYILFNGATQKYSKVCYAINRKQSLFSQASAFVLLRDDRDSGWESVHFVVSSVCTVVLGEWRKKVTNGNKRSYVYFWQVNVKNYQSLMIEVVVWPLFSTHGLIEDQG